MLSIFLCVCLPSICLLWINVYFDLLLSFWMGYFSFFILCCVRCLYIFEINPLSVVWFANIFSHSKGCLFVLLLVSFTVQKFVSLIRCHLFIFGFITLQGRSKKSYCNLCQRVFYIFLQEFYSAQPYIKSLAHFEFIFVYGIRVEKATAIHSSTLAWKIPWTEESGRLQSIGSQRVGHDWVTSLSLFIFMHWRRKWQPTPIFLPGESQGRESGGLQSVGSHRVGHWLSSSMELGSAQVSFFTCSCPVFPAPLIEVTVFFHCIFLS